MSPVRIVPDGLLQKLPSGPFPRHFDRVGALNWGLVGVQQSEFGGGASKTWVCHMAPRSWTQTDISAFLLSQGWGQVKVLDRRKSLTKGSPPEWLFQGLRPTESSPEQSSWVYADEDNTMSVSVAPPRKRKQVASCTLQGPRKRWVDQDLFQSSQANDLTVPGNQDQNQGCRNCSCCC